MKVKSTIHDIANQTLTVRYIKSTSYIPVLRNPFDYTKYDHNGNKIK